MATLPRTRLARAAVQLLDTYSTTHVAQLLGAILVEHHKVREADLLLADVAIELLHTKRHLLATITSAHPLSPSTIKIITKLLQDHYQATKVTITKTIDPSILGGFHVQTPVGEIDSTLSQALNKLKLQLL